MTGLPDGGQFFDVEAAANTTQSFGSLIGSYVPAKRQNARHSLEEESFRGGCPTDVQKPSRMRGSQNALISLHKHPLVKNEWLFQEYVHLIFN